MEEQNYQEADFLAQTPPSQVEGSMRQPDQIIYEPHTLTLVSGARDKVRTRQRGDFWRIAVLADGVTGDTVRVAIGQGEIIDVEHTTLLGDGGTVLQPAAQSVVTVENQSACTVYVIVIAEQSLKQESYTPGKSLL